MSVCPARVALPTEGVHPSPLERHHAGWLEKEKMLRTKNLMVEAGRGGACGTAVDV